MREGDVGDCAYIILDGHCQANRNVAGKTQMLRLLGPGEMFGETAVLTGSPRSATVTALMDTTVAVVDRVYLEEEMQRTSLMALAIRTVATSFLDLNGADRGAAARADVRARHRPAASASSRSRARSAPARRARCRGARC